MSSKPSINGMEGVCGGGGGNADSLALATSLV